MREGDGNSDSRIRQSIVMDHAAYHVIYVDNRTHDDLDGKRIHKSQLEPYYQAKLRSQESWKERSSDVAELVLRQIEEVRSNIRVILSTFNEVCVCTSGTTCLAKLAELESISTNLLPILVILEVRPEIDSDDDKHRELSMFSSPTDGRYERQVHSTHSAGSEGRYSLLLLQRIHAEISISKLSKLVVPIAMVSQPKTSSGSAYDTQSIRPQHLSLGNVYRSNSSVHSGHSDLSNSYRSVDPRKMRRCLDAGAVDVLMSPLQSDRVYGLSVHGYRAHKEADDERTASLATNRIRKRSWVGFDDKKPYAYLREDMVSGLMTGICNPDNVPHAFDHRTLPILLPKEESDMIRAIGSWAFSAHDYSEEDLVHVAFFILQHALAMPELEKWRLPADELKSFLMASRAAYNSFVLYHNFRHVIDVLQATFFFLVQLGTLPPYPPNATMPEASKNPSPIAALLKPFDALTLLISAIGHDVGHPGVNNAFLVALNAPLAQLYNDKSVLEAFHCAAYSQILRRYWKSAFEDTSMRGLLINSILATDMGVHFKYMTDLGNLQDKVHHNQGTEGWSPQTLDEYRTLACGLLIKCADISNAARPFAVAAQWSQILQEEFANQGEMEKEVGIPTTLFGGPPELGNVIKLANSQIGFMNIFARPLFEAVADVLPAMGFAVDEIKINQGLWKSKIEQERTKEDSRKPKRKFSTDGFVSPRSGSPNLVGGQSQLAHPEGFPASQPSSHVPVLSVSQDVDKSDTSRQTSAESNQSTLIIPGTATPSQSNDMSRRSSLGLPIDHGSPHDSTSFSRRSSGAFPDADIHNSSLSTRTSSNTMPSQLQLAPGPELASQLPTPIPLAGKSSPSGREPDDDVSRSNSAGDLNVVQEHTSGDGTPPAFPGGGVGVRHPRLPGYSSENSPLQGNFPPSNYRVLRCANNSSSGPLSAVSSHNRSSSSGAQTSVTQSVPYSPTGTLATSFLTTDSDEKSIHEGTDGWNDSTDHAVPDLLDTARTGGAQPFESTSRSIKGKEHNVKPTAPSASSPGHGSRDRSLRRQNSRFRLDFWRKKGKSTDSSP